MSLVLVGVNHKSAPVEVRERLAVQEWRLQEATRKLLEIPGVEEAYILSTCNRVELLVANSKDGDEGRYEGTSAIHNFLREYFAIDTNHLAQHLYEVREREAVQHVFRVTASLDSMIVGEPQILGQVKSAYAIARSTGAMGPQLDELLSRALSVAKRVRSETAIGSSAVSVASVAVDLAKKIFGSLKGRHVYLVGAGKMSELAARHLLAHGAESIIVANRTHERAIKIAEEFGGQAIRFEDLYHTADRADIIITSTGAPHAIFRREHAEMFLQRRKNRPMFFIDIAVPRDVDAELNKLDGIFVYDIDDLQQVVHANLQDRSLEAGRAEQIIEDEVRRYEARVHGREATPTIVSLQQHVEAIRRAELERARGKLGKLSPEQEMAVEALTRAIVNKMLHPSLVGLKRDKKSFGEMVKRVFGISTADENAPESEAHSEMSQSLSSGTKRQS
jgi:glutamyl-tRNA reductase